MDKKNKKIQRALSFTGCLAMAFWGVANVSGYAKPSAVAAQEKESLELREKNALIAPMNALKTDCVSAVKLEAAIDSITNVVGNVEVARDTAKQGKSEGTFPLFAGSNIYWDEENMRLAFDDAGCHEHEHFQGLYFKFGSLVGVAPLSIFGKYTPTYRPSTDGTGSFVPDIPIRQGWDDWSKIPCSRSGLESAFYLPEFTGSVNPDDAITVKDLDDIGDVCERLSGMPGIPAGRWRLPSKEDFGLLEALCSFIGGNGEDDFTGKDDGTAQIHRGIVGGMDCFFPLAGCINAHKEGRPEWKAVGCYWTGDFNEETQFAHFLMVDDKGHAYSEFSEAPDMGFSVRCVRAD